MDTKKNLKPELKEIYERVMNTNPSARTTPPPVSDSKPVQPAVTTPQKSPETAPTPPTPSPVAPQEPFLTSSAPRAINDS
ncbi:MAG TPA: hypothetical protein PLD54_04120, partial [Candidatus Levybacteria bacterium]|nr:hypothetical protein [Candidatus Levybacteria bacterium]